MAITTLGYPLGWMNCWTVGIDMDAATWKLALSTSTFAPNRDTMDFYNDVTNELATASGYTAGGVTLTAITITYDSATDQVRVDSADPGWTFSANVQFRYGNIYIDTAGASTTDPLMLLLDWATTQDLSGVYSVTVDPAGWFAVDFT